MAHVIGAKDIPATCGECQHASWERTPTGRIKSKWCGRCTKESELRAMFTVTNHSPCLAMGSVTTRGIWPNYDASGCPLRAKGIA